MPRAAAIKNPTTLKEMEKYEGTLYVRNNTPHAVSCNTKDQQFLLEPSGHDGSIQVMPKGCLTQSGFVKIWKRGDLTISPDLEDEASEASERVALAEKKRLDAISAMTEENASNKDLVEAKCLISGELVFQSQQDVNDLVPPLAERYKNRAYEFVPTQVQQPDGTVRTTFNRTQISTDTIT